MSASKKAKQIAKYFRQERADYEYTKDVFKKLREILDIKVTKKQKSYLTFLLKKRLKNIMK